MGRKRGYVPAGGVERESTEGEGPSVYDPTSEDDLDSTEMEPMHISGGSPRRKLDRRGGDGGDRGPLPHRTRWICCSFCCTLVLVSLVIFLIPSKLIAAALRAGAEKDYKKFQQQFVRRETIDPMNIKSNLRDLTDKPHIAGSLNDEWTAAYVRDKMKAYGFQASLVNYSVLLMYPQVQDNLPYAELTGSCASGSCSQRNGEAWSRGVFTARLEEPALPGDTLTATSNGPGGAGQDAPEPWGGSSRLPYPTFNGFSPSTPTNGVSGPVVYANYGRREDFELLAKYGVNVSGAIVIARYGKLFRGSKADNANNAGAKALLIYSDPADYAPEGTDAGAFVLRLVVSLIRTAARI